MSAPKIVHCLVLPIETRTAKGLPARCDRCAESISEETFVLGFLEDYRYAVLHHACVDSDEPFKFQTAH